MKSFIRQIVFTLALFIGFSGISCAQLLDDDDLQSVPSQTNTQMDETDNNEALFNEMFSDYSENERDITKAKTFDDAISAASEMLEKSKNKSASIEQLEPLNGDILIGITKGSFKIFQKMTGKMSCSFSVTVKSNLDREIKLLGLSLIYPKSPFAFIFRNVSANGTQTRYITTSGDVCYNLEGAPDIDVNLCKIRNATGAECAKRLKWSDTLGLEE